MTASKVLRPNSDYHVAVSVMGTSQPTQVSIEVGGKQDSGGLYTVNQDVTVSPYTTQIAKLEVTIKIFRPYCLNLSFIHTNDKCVSKE